MCDRRRHCERKNTAKVLKEVEAVPSSTCIMERGKVAWMKRISAPKGIRRKTCCTPRIVDIFPQFQRLVLLLHVMVLCKQPANDGARKQSGGMKGGAVS